MKKIIKQNGKYYNRCKVHLLETKEEAKIYSRHTSNVCEYLEILDKPQIANTINSECKGYHIYITSEEEIEEGDLCILGYPGESKCLVNADISKIGDNLIINRPYDNYKFHISFGKKIIATTDTSLKFKCECCNNGIIENEQCRTCVGGYIDAFPQPSKQFIEKYIEEYNKGIEIEEVLVEYDELYTGEEIKQAPIDRVLILDEE